jgi:hypothetical protein
MVILGGRAILLGDEVVIDIDHPADDTLKIPLGQHFVDGIGQILVRAFL